MSGGIAIETVDLTRRFGAVTALDGLDLKVPAGCVYGFLGPNGAGKTTTLHLLLGLLAPTSGAAYVLGIDALRDPARVRRLSAALLEHNGLYERLTAEENLEFYARLWDVPLIERPRLYRALLEPFGLWQRRHEKVGQWSKGMKQKVAIARVLLARPRVIFLDEPTNGLDPVSAVEIRDTLRRLARDEGVTVFLNTHNLPEAERTCDRVAVLHRGRLVAEGTPDRLMQGDATVLDVSLQKVTKKVLMAVGSVAGVEDVQTSEGGLVVRMGAEASAAPVVAALVQAGAAVEEVRRAAVGLEDVFLALTREDAE